MSQISVVVPVYKVEAYLERCVDSILGQTFSDFELILVDDGSPDNCGAICDRYAEKDSRVHVIHQSNGGLSAARNAGIDWAFANSDSQWLAFVDSDDWVNRDYLKILMGMARKHSVPIAMCDFQEKAKREPDDLTDSLESFALDTRDAYAQYYPLCMTAWCKVYRKSLWEKYRFPLGKLHEDAYITHRVLFEADRVALCTAQLYCYFVNQSSITRAKWSPRRLDQIAAHEERLQYWRQLEYRDCYLRELTVYADVLCVQIRQIQEDSTTENVKHLPELRKKLRCALSEGRKNGMYPFVEEYWGEYVLAYPQKLERIWTYFRIKLMRRG